MFCAAPEGMGIGPRGFRPSYPILLPINVPEFILSNNGAFPWKEVGKLLLEIGALREKPGVAGQGVCTTVLGLVSYLSMGNPTMLPHSVHEPS